MAMAGDVPRARGRRRRGTGLSGGAARGRSGRLAVSRCSSAGGLGGTGSLYITSDPRLLADIPCDRNATALKRGPHPYRSRAGPGPKFGPKRVGTLRNQPKLKRTEALLKILTNRTFWHQ